MKTFAVRLSFRSFLKLMVLGCFCGALVLAPINAFIAAMSGEGGEPGYYYLLAPVGGLIIGTILGVPGYPVYAFLSKRFPKLSTFKGVVLDEAESAQVAP